MRERFSGPYAVATMGMILVIIYGSLYPFEFSIPATGPGAIQALIESWANRPGRGDFLANVLLYIPVGFFGGLAFSRRTALVTRFLGTALLGAVLSISMELTQYYDIGRDTAATDVYANVLGTLLGTFPGVVFQVDHRGLLVRQIVANRIPALLVLTWVSYRLYPYVPTIDLHKYWDTLKPIVLTPQVSAYDLFRHTAIWLTVYTLVSRITTILRPWLLMPLFAAGVLFSKILIISTSLSVAEIAGALVAYLIWIVFRPLPKTCLAVTIIMFGTMIVAQRLEPFQFAAYPVPFGWIPFRSFMRGSIEVNILSFLEKSFLYGSLIWLLIEGGLRRAVAATLVAGALLVTSIAEMYLPGRSAEITDTLMALAIAATFALVTRGDASASTSI